MCIQTTSGRWTQGLSIKHTYSPLGWHSQLPAVLPILRGSPESTCSRRVIFALAEAGVEFTFQPIDLAKTEQKTETFLEKQPYGKVLVWEDACIGLELFESRAIMKHVARYTPMIPKDTVKSAHMEQWISVEYSYLYPDFMQIYSERVLKIKYHGPDAESDEAICAAKELSLANTLDLLERHLASSGADFLVGPFSLADVTFTPYLALFGPCGLDALLDTRPAVAAWADRCAARPGWQYVASGGVMGRTGSPIRACGSG